MFVWLNPFKLWKAIATRAIKYDPADRPDSSRALAIQLNTDCRCRTLNSPLKHRNENTDMCEHHWGFRLSIFVTSHQASTTYFFLPLYATTCITRLLVIDDCLNDLPLSKLLLFVINIGFLPMTLMCRISSNDRSDANIIIT